MNTNPDIKSTDNTLRSLADTYGSILNALSSKLLPNGYRFNFTRIVGKDYTRYGIEADGPDGADFAFSIANAPDAQSITIAAETLQRTVWAANNAKADAEYEKTHPRRTWRSRYADIERPHLVLDHTPGWGCEDVSMNDSEVVHQLFRSDYDPLGLSFTVFENDRYPVSISFGGEIDWTVDTPGELLKLGDQTGELAKWFDDCAMVTAWAKDHDTVKDGDDHE